VLLNASARRVRTQIAQCRAFRDIVPHQFLRGQREQRLTAVAGWMHSVSSRSWRASARRLAWDWGSERRSISANRDVTVQVGNALRRSPPSDAMDIRPTPAERS
jgi:hypothetical protein